MVEMEYVRLHYIYGNYYILHGLYELSYVIFH